MTHRTQTGKINTNRLGGVWIWLSAVFVLLGIGGALAWWVLLGSGIGDGPTTEETELVPEDAQAFVTVFVADALKTQQVDKLMKSLDRLADGAELNPLRRLHAFEEKVGITLSDVEQVTFVAGKLEDKVYWVVVRTSKKIEVSKFLPLLGRFEKIEYAGKPYRYSSEDDIALYGVSDTQVIVAPQRGMERVLDLMDKPEKGGPLNGALKLAARKEHHVVAAVNMGGERSAVARRELAARAKGTGFDAELAAIALHLEMLTYTARFGDKLVLNLTAEFESAEAARDAGQGLERLRSRASAALSVAGKQFPDAAALAAALDQMRPVQSGAKLTLKAEVDADVLVNALLRWLLNRGEAVP